MKRTLLVGLIALAAIGLATFLFLGKAKQVTYAGDLMATLKPLPEVRLSANGVPIPAYRVAYEEVDRALHISLATASFEVKSEGSRREPPAPLRISGEMLFPCGWKPVNIKVLKAPTTQQISAAMEGDRPLAVNLSVDQGFPRDWLGVWVDNRSGEQFELSLGQLKYTIPAGSSAKWDFAVPDCDEGSVMRINGTEIGVVPQKGDAVLNTAMQLLVDVSGKRCYRSRDLEYNNMGWTAQAPQTRTYRGERLHKLDFGAVSFFLQPAPKTISSQDFSVPGTDMPFALAHELVEVPCR